MGNITGHNDMSFTLNVMCVFCEQFNYGLLVTVFILRDPNNFDVFIFVIF